MIGALRHRLILEVPVPAPDGGGGANISWTEQATMWASVERTRGGEQDRADRPDARIQIRVRMRYRSDVTTAMRFRDGSAIFNIRSALDEEGRRRVLTCLCEEGAGS